MNNVHHKIIFFGGCDYMFYKPGDTRGSYIFYMCFCFCILDLAIPTVVHSREQEYMLLLSYIKLLNTCMLYASSNYSAQFPPSAQNSPTTLSITKRIFFYRLIVWGGNLTWLLFSSTLSIHYIFFSQSISNISHQGFHIVIFREKN